MALVADIAAILFEADPIGINFNGNTDEYDIEAKCIVARLKDARGTEDAQRITHEEFVRWFDADLAGPIERYAEIGAAIWAAVSREKYS